MINTFNEEKLNTLKDIHLSDIEKAELGDGIKHFMASHPLQTKRGILSYLKQNNLILSPYGGISITFTKSLVFSLLALITMGGTATFASGSAVPGELLYPIKINIKEKLEEKLATTQEEKLTIKEKKVTRRLEEVKTLQNKKGLTKKEAVIAQTILKEHIKELTDTMNTLKEEGREDLVLASTAELIPKTEDLTKILSDDSSTLSKETSTLSVESGETLAAAKVENTETAKVETDSGSEEKDIFKDIAEEDSVLIKETLHTEVQRQIQEIKKTVEKVATDKVSDEKTSNSEVTKEPIEQKKEEVKELIKKVNKKK